MNPTPDPTPNPTLPPDLSSLPLLSTSTPLTLTLQIPFLLLGTPSVPPHIYTHTERRTKPLSALLFLLRHTCPAINTRVWIPRSMAADLEIHGLEYTAGLSEQEKVEQRREWEDKERERWLGVRENAWVLRYADGKETRGWVGRWRDGDGCLTPNQERECLAHRIWSTPVVLQRFGTPVSRQAEVMGECRRLCEALLRFNIAGGQGLRVVWNQRCQLRMEVMRDNGCWGCEDVAKILLMLAAFEREIALLGSMDSVVQFCPLSRFLMYFFTERLKAEKGRIWKNVGGKKLVFDYEKERWEKEVRGEDVRFVIDEPEGWTMLDQVWQEGEERMGELVREMGACEGGGRMAVSFSTTSQNDDGDANDVGDERADTDRRQPHSSRASTPEPSPAPAFPDIESVIFQSHNSSLDPEDIAAYTDFATQFLVYASTYSYATLRLRIQAFRATARNLDEEPLTSLKRLLALIEVQRSTKIYYYNLLGKRYGNSKEEQVESENEEDGGVDACDKPKTPFDGVLKIIGEHRMKAEKYVQRYIERYARAGGFYAVPRNKLYAVMVAEDEARKARKLGERGDDRGRAGNRWAGRKELDLDLDKMYEVGRSGLVLSPGVEVFGERLGAEVDEGWSKGKGKEKAADLFGDTVFGDRMGGPPSTKIDGVIHQWREGVEGHGERRLRRSRST